MVYTHRGISQTLEKKKNEILPFVTIQMDLAGIELSEISQKKTNTVMISLICGIQITKQKQSHRFREQTLVARWEERNS